MPPADEQDSIAEYHRICSRSYAVLYAARQQATKTKQYNSAHTRAELQRIFTEKFGKAPYDWQLDVTEAMLLGLDTVLIAGTGCGKTMPFMMMLLLDALKVALIVSPLKVLQADQAERFNKMGITAVAVNGDTWIPKKLGEKIKTGTYQALFAGPEMYIKHEGFRDSIRAISSKILAAIVDEAHCISQWGGDFRKDYALLDDLRLLLPPGTPILVASATLNPATLKDVMAKLSISSDTCFHLNLGNDRPNISTTIYRMKSSSDFDSLCEHLTFNAIQACDIPKSIIFTNSIKAAQHGLRHLQGKYSPEIMQHLDCFHAMRSLRDKKKAMFRFHHGDLRILLATEAAGMGADIPDIEVAIQFGVPSSLSIFKQRIGRAGWDPSINARAILLAEASMFKLQKANKTSKAKDTEADSDDDSGLSDSGVDHARARDGQSQGDEDKDDAEEGGAPSNSTEAEENTGQAPKTLQQPAVPTKAGDRLKWRKQVEPSMREWIETKRCERDYCDEHYNNPPDRKLPTGVCCDRCTPSNVPDDDDNIELERPITPEQDSPVGIPNTPSKTPNENGKRVMTRGLLPALRRDDFLKSARAALLTWRMKTIKTYKHAPFTVAVLLPDKTLTALAASTRWKDVDDIRAQLKLEWLFVEMHGQDVLDVLAQVNREEMEKREEVKRAKKAVQEQKKTLRDQEKAAQKEAALEKKQVERNRRTQEKADRHSSLAAAKQARRLAPTAPASWTAYASPPPLRPSPNTTRIPIADIFSPAPAQCNTPAAYFAWRRSQLVTPLAEVDNLPRHPLVGSQPARLESTHSAETSLGAQHQLERGDEENTTYQME